MSSSPATDLNPDEIRVTMLARTATFGMPSDVKDRMVEALYLRLVGGADVYGHFDPADPRDFAAEAGDEACDGINYCAMAEERARDRGEPTARYRDAAALFARAAALLDGVGG